MEVLRIDADELDSGSGYAASLYTLDNRRMVAYLRNQFLYSTRWTYLEHGVLQAQECRSNGTPLH